MISSELRVMMQYTSGAYARRLTEHAIQLSLVLEMLCVRSEEMSTVGDFMVRNLFVQKTLAPN